MPLALHYFTVAPGALVLCDAPVGSAYFCPRRSLDPEPDGAIPGQWRVASRVQSLPRRARIIIFDAEVLVSAFTLTLRRVASRLSSRRRADGILGIILKAEPYTCDDGRVQRMAFFHVAAPLAWDVLHPGITVRGPVPSGYPSSL